VTAWTYFAYDYQARSVIATTAVSPFLRPSAPLGVDRDGDDRIRPKP
jgi:hypothetical protein